jgi:septal ring factor EnvC (AmiA/AmiB activator)
LTRLKAVRAERDRERAAFLKTKDEVRARRTVLGELLKKKQAERDMAAALAAAAQRETAALASRATSLREVIERLERLARTISPRLKPPAPKIRPPGADPEIARGPLTADSKSERFRPTTAFAQARGALKPPVVGRVIGAFGSRTATGGRLDGLRFAAPDAALVTAPFEAKVAFARAWNPVGNLVVLDVGGGYHMLLLGVNVFLVQEGETVAAGQPIATMAAKAGAREANLDLEIRKNGEPVNPSLWLSRKSVDEMGF